MEPEHAPGIICGGFPCQDVSVAGKRRGITGERTGLVSHLLRLVRVLRPRVVVLENVPGVLGGLGEVLGPLAALGYDAAWGVLGACCVGAPHKRERVFIVASDPDREPLHVQQIGQSRCTGSAFAGWDGSPQSLAYPNRQRELQPQGPDQDQRGWVGDGMWWSSEPSMGRVAYGLPSRVDRLRSLGNAVVWQQAAKAIRELYQEVTRVQ
jgi:DNA (cytosine-5)-methyltransferase 1